MECIWCKSFEQADLPEGTKVKCFACGKDLIKQDPLRMLADMFWGAPVNTGHWNPLSDLFNKK